MSRKTWFGAAVISAIILAGAFIALWWDAWAERLWADELDLRELIESWEQDHAGA